MAGAVAPAAMCGAVVARTTVAPRGAHLAMVRAPPRAGMLAAVDASWRPAWAARSGGGSGGCNGDGGGRCNRLITRGHALSAAASSPPRPLTATGLTSPGHASENFAAAARRMPGGGGATAAAAFFSTSSARGARDVARTKRRVVASASFADLGLDPEFLVATLYSES